MKKMYLCNVILILSIFMGGCGTGGTAIAEQNNILTRDEELTMDIQSTENKINNTPTKDEDTANQIAERRSQMEEEISTEIFITIQDITDGKLIIFLENTSNEGMALGEICIMKNEDGNWSEVERKSNAINELPGYLIQSQNTMQIEFDYAAKYGELSKGLYMCVINISGVSIQAEFEID